MYKKYRDTYEFFQFAILFPFRFVGTSISFLFLGLFLLGIFRGDDDSSLLLDRHSQGRAIGFEEYKLTPTTMDRKRKWDQPGEEGDAVVKAQKTDEGSKSATAAAAAVSFVCFFARRLTNITRIPSLSQCRPLLQLRSRRNLLVLQL